MSQTLLQLEKCYVLIVALENDSFEYYITEPKIFYSSYDDAKKIRDALIERKELKEQQIKIQTIWKVNS